jgi:hypothetical protein
MPGRPVPVDALLDAGWPGESPLPEAAMNRLYVAMNRLRHLGLRDVLERAGDGYRLKIDPKMLHRN